MLHRQDDLTGRLLTMAWAHRLNGVFLIIGWLAIATIGWFALAKLADNIYKNPDVGTDLPPLAAMCIDYRACLPLASAPALVIGILLLRSGRTRQGAWLLFGLGMLWLVGVFGLILYSFISFLAPFYRYQPL